MSKENKLRWTDAILPFVIIVIAIASAYYVLNYPQDKMVSGYLTQSLIVKAVRRHLYLIAVASGLSILTSVPLGIILTRPMFKKLSTFVVGLVNLCQTVPSLAVIALTFSFLGIGTKTAIFALWIYSLLPILNNTIVGINGVNPAILDSARGMGMSKSRILTNVEIPLAMPIIMAGIRTAVVICVATAVIAAYVGAGGLGDLIIAGKNINRLQVLLLGAGFATLIALLLDHLLGLVERILTQ